MRTFKICAEYGGCNKGIENKQIVNSALQQCGNFAASYLACADYKTPGLCQIKKKWIITHLRCIAWPICNGKRTEATLAHIRISGYFMP